MPFDLTTNPFYLLGTTVRARRDEIVDAYDAAVARGADEAVLSKAQQTVLTPRSRISAELSWLSGVAPRHAKQIADKVQRGDLQDAVTIVDGLQGLDKANFAADLCVRTGDQRFLVSLIRSHGEFTPATIGADLAALRAVAGFPVPDDRLLQEGLSSLRLAHAKAGLVAVCRSPDPGESLTAFVEVFVDDRNENIRLFLASLVREYDSWSVPALGEIRDRIERAIANDGLTGSSASPNEVAALLSEWDALSQPVQLIELSKGHEESRSRQIYETVRAFELTLANDESRYRDALVLARALLDTFPELPTAAEKLAEDIDKLEELADAAEFDEIVGPLQAALESAQADLPTFAVEVVGRGFGPWSEGLAKALYDAFSRAAGELAASGNRDMPWETIRGFAVDLHNEHDQAQAAAALVRGLLSHDGARPSPEVVEALTRDESAVTRTVNWAAIRKIKPSDPGASAIVEFLLRTAQGDEREALRRIQNTIAEVKARAIKVRLGWTSAAVCLVALWVYAGTRGELEELPPPGTQRTLSRSETRGCVFQSERLQFLYSIVSQNPEDRNVEEYNRLVADYQARCENKNYRDDHLSAAQGAATQRQGALLEEARRMLRAR